MNKVSYLLLLIAVLIPNLLMEFGKAAEPVQIPFVDVPVRKYVAVDISADTTDDDVVCLALDADNNVGFLTYDGDVYKSYTWSASAGGRLVQSLRREVAPDNYSGVLFCSLRPTSVDVKGGVCGVIDGIESDINILNGGFFASNGVVKSLSFYKYSLFNQGGLLLDDTYAVPVAGTKARAGKFGSIIMYGNVDWTPTYFMGFDWGQDLCVEDHSGYIAGNSGMTIFQSQPDTGRLGINQAINCVKTKNGAEFVPSIVNVEGHAISGNLYWNGTGLAKIPNCNGTVSLNDRDQVTGFASGANGAAYWDMKNGESSVILRDLLPDVLKWQFKDQPPIGILDLTPQDSILRIMMGGQLPMDKKTQSKM